MTSLSDALTVLRAALVEASLPLNISGVDDARKSRAELLDQIDDYLLPRLAALDAPLLAVIGGSTGSGKSTMTNTMVGEVVSPAGVLRPTTRAPVLVCHPDDASWFLKDGVLPDLPRVTGHTAATGSVLHVRQSEVLPPGLAILDSPDIDSVEIANHELAAQLLGAADLWLFVTTAARYADAVPWEYLARAAERAIALALVINRIPQGAEAEVRSHLSEMLDARGLGAAKIFSITEGTVVDDQLGAGIEEIRSWLYSLSADAEGRRALVRSTIDGAVASIPSRANAVVAGVEVQSTTVEALRTLAQHRYVAALQEIDKELASGNLLRSEVLNTWQEHVGTGEFMQKLQRGVSQIRDRIMSVFTGSSATAEAEVRGELESSLAALVRNAADNAALDVVEGWEALPGGSQLLDDGPRDLSRASASLTDRYQAEIAEWEDGVLRLVRDQSGEKVALARGLSFGINTIGVTLMVAVFSQTGGVTGGEAGVAAGTAAVSQAMLSAIFGEQAVRDLANMARDDLKLRLVQLLEDERLRFDELLGSIPAQAAAASLQEALEVVANADE